MIRFNRTKIIATLGPSSTEKSVVRQMIEAGADVFRLNFSHISHQKALEAIVTVRDLNDELGTTVALLADLQGPKLRVGKVEEGGIVLKKGKEIRITTQQLTGNSQCISVSYENLAADVRPFEQILIDDGNITLEIISTDGVSEVTARVVYGGLLTSNKGFNLHGQMCLCLVLQKKTLKTSGLPLNITLSGLVCHLCVPHLMLLN
jgi:pyruvate kinase